MVGTKAANLEYNSAVSMVVPMAGLTAAQLAPMRVGQKAVKLAVLKVEMLAATMVVTLDKTLVDWTAVCSVVRLAGQ